MATLSPTLRHIPTASTHLPKINCTALTLSSPPSAIQISNLQAIQLQNTCHRFITSRCSDINLYHSDASTTWTGVIFVLWSIESIKDLLYYKLPVVRRVNTEGTHMLTNKRDGYHLVFLNGRLNCPVCRVSIVGED